MGIVSAGVIPDGAGGALAGGVIPAGVEYFCKFSFFMLLT